MGNDTAIKIEGLWKRFRLYHERHQTLKDTVLSRRRARFEEFWAIKDLNLNVRKGETLGVIGRNGSGKSTLLKLIAKILVPTRGAITVQGRLASLLELGAGFESDLTGRENIYLNGSILGLTKREIDEKFDQIVAFSELDKFIDTPVKNYSSGMHVRLGFSVAVHTDPDILLVDEVLAVGDEAFQKKCLEKIRSFKDEGRTILFVTHEADVVKRICDRAIMLEAGEIALEGAPREVVRKYHEVMLKMSKRQEGGTGEVAIKGVRLLDSEGVEENRFDAGSPMIIQIDFEAREPVKDPVFGFGFYDQMENKVFGTNTELRCFKTGLVQGKGTMEFRLDNLSLLDGTFSLTVAIHSSRSERVYHWQERFYQFKVVNSFQDEGICFIPCKFRLTQGDEVQIEEAR